MSNSLYDTYKSASPKNFQLKSYSFLTPINEQSKSSRNIMTQRSLIEAPRTYNKLDIKYINTDIAKHKTYYDVLRPYKEPEIVLNIKVSMNIKKNRKGLRKIKRREIMQCQIIEIL